jgi:hypothetical protein
MLDRIATVNGRLRCAIIRGMAIFVWRGQRGTAAVVLSIGRICGKEGKLGEQLTGFT